MTIEFARNAFNSMFRAAKPEPCPTCGAPILVRDTVAMMRIVSPTMAEIMDCMLKRPGQFIPRRDLEAYVWRRKPEDRPIEAASVIHSTIYYNRETLNRLGWDIEGRPGRTGGMRLVALSKHRKVA